MRRNNGFQSHSPRQNKHSERYHCEFPGHLCLRGWKYTQMHCNPYYRDVK